MSRDRHSRLAVVSNHVSKPAQSPRCPRAYLLLNLTKLFLEILLAPLSEGGYGGVKGRTVQSRGQPLLIYSQLESRHGEGGRHIQTPCRSIAGRAASEVRKTSLPYVLAKG